MRKGMIKALVLSAVFCFGVLGFGQFTNHSNQDLTMEMADATLPVISLYIHNSDTKERMEVNELHGYTSQMNGVSMRDTITPVGQDRILPIQVRMYGTKVDKLSYEIRSLDMDRLIADSMVEEYQEEGNTIEADLPIQNLLEVNQEYQLILKLGSGEHTIYYYTRIMEERDCYTDRGVAFALDFHNKTFDKKEAESLAVYLEPNALGDNSALSHVDIHSSLKQVAWADFAGERLTTPVPSVKEVNSSYTVIVLNYLVEGEGTGGELEYYNVEEYFRVRYTSERMYLLNYERTMEQVIRAENLEVYDNYIQLGIRSQEVEFASNEKGNIVSFVQAGELWSYNASLHQLSKVFSFIDNEGVDERENYGEHDIRIINIDETGSMNFVVYGYMNCGSHEGEVGICVYHYDSVANTIEEGLFIPSDRSYQILKADLGQFMYENAQGVIFILMYGTVYRIDLQTMQVREYITGLREGFCAISQSRRYFAWTDSENPYEATEISFVNLDTEEERKILAGDKEYVKPLGFMDDDFVYGAASKDRVGEDLAGNTVFPMHRVTIADSVTLENLKSYEKEGFFVSDIEIDDYIMYLNRIQFNGTSYTEAAQDTIMNREGDGAAIVGVHTTVTEVKQTQVQLSLAEEVKNTSPKFLTPREVVFEEEREIALENTEDGRCYYVYARGDVWRGTDDLREAISVANETMGVVIGTKQQYVWKRARKSMQTALDVQVGEEDAAGSPVAQCVSAMLMQQSVNISVSALLEQGKTPKEILETTMEHVTVLDLTGCSLEEILYYINLGTPVFAMQNNVEAVLVTGYDAVNVSLFHPSAGGTTKMGLHDATELFENTGNIFLGYILD